MRKRSHGKYLNLFAKTKMKKKVYNSLRNTSTLIFLSFKNEHIVNIHKKMNRRLWMEKVDLFIEFVLQIVRLC